MSTFDREPKRYSDHCKKHEGGYIAARAHYTYVGLTDDLRQNGVVNETDNV